MTQGTEALKMLHGVVPQKHLCALVSSQEGLNMFTLPSHPQQLLQFLPFKEIIGMNDGGCQVASSGTQRPGGILCILWGDVLMEALLQGD